MTKDDIDNASFDELLKILKSQRLMLYAAKAARADFGLLDNHHDQSIAETKEVIARAERRRR